MRQDATLRDLARKPHDVQIDDLSRTGCHIATLLALPIGVVLSIGIPQIGVHALRVVRETEGGYGCAFETSLAQSDLRIALAAEANNVAVPFGEHQTPATQRERLTPPGLIGAGILLAIAVSWAITYLLLRVIGIS
jgi:hypothetical protein